LHGTTLFMTLLAGWSILLARLSDQSDLVIGTSVANRQRTEIEPLIGFFVNTLALRIKLGDICVAELLRQVKALTLDAYAHQDVPFEQVVEALQPARSLSHSPLFQVLFSLDHNPAADTLALPGLQLTQITAPRTTTQFDLLLSLADTGEVITGDLHYASDLFERSTIERIVRQLQRVLSLMVADEQQPIARLPLLSPAERQQVLLEWNATQEPYGEQLIPQLFERQAARQPGATALVYQDQSLTYGQLNTQANQLAHHLLSLGIRPDDRIALCVERSLDMVVGLLGILKAGAAYVPLDPNSPEARLSFMLTDCAPVALLTQATLAERLPAMSMLRVLVLDDPNTQALIARQPADNIEPGALGLTPSHLAYVIYTSGSTGQPKGVMVEHRGLTHYVQWAQRHYLSSTLVDSLADSLADAIVSSPLAFDATITTVYAPLIRGGALVLIPEGEEVAGLASLLRQPRSWALMKITPAHLAALAKLLQADSLSCAVQCVVVGGEALPAATAALWQTLCPSGRLINEYGPTETVVGCSLYEAGNSSPARDDLPIGRPIANMTMYLLDTHRQPVPIGVTGEIYIGGVQLARGYLNRPELTRERFLPDPFRGEPDARMYKTGDLGRYLPDGNIVFLGRNDFQVKIRGFRIELGEIEAQLRACRGVREALVIARHDAPGEKRLVAYVVPTEGAAPSVAQLRTQLAAHLAEYMVPTAFVTLPALPLTANGKLDRRALPAPEADAFLKRAYEAPTGQIEIAIAEIWQDLLHLKQVGRHDHFFELGGHSLLVVTFIERLQHLGLTIDIRSVFAGPTLAAIAAIVADNKNGTPTVVTPPNLIPADGASVKAITPAMLPLVKLTQADIDRIVATVPQGVTNVQDVYPLAPLQEGILFHHLLDADSDAYLTRVVFAFDNRCRLDAFLNSLQQVVKRHDILRTAVLWTGLPQPVQVVYRHAPLPIHDLQLQGVADALQTVLSRTDIRRTRLDLQRAPLMSLYLARNPESDEWFLSLLTHHMVLDHITLDLIIEEIQAVGQGHGEHLPPVVPYRNFVAQGRAISATEHEAYFKAQLSDVDEPTAPFGLLDVQSIGEQAQKARSPLSDELASRIREQASRLGVTTAVLFHVAWAQVVAHCTGRDDVVFGTVLLGRLHGAQGVNRASGMFINTLPLRIPLANRTAHDVVSDTYRRLSELLIHEQASLALAQHCSGVRAPLPLFTTFLNYRHSHDITTEDNGAPANVLEGTRALFFEERTNYPLSASIDDMGQGFSLTAQCVRGVDPARVTAYLHSAIESLVTALAGESQQPILALSVLPAAERQQLLVDWNATTTPYGGDPLLHQLFEGHAAANPDATALVYQDRSLTYGQLNAKANQLAHHLLSLGIHPDDRIALCLERSLDMVVGLLGILKAGAACVPLDPEYPEARLAFMLCDCAPVALLTQTSLAERLPAMSMLRVLALDEPSTQQILAHQPLDNLEPAALGLTPAHLAYVIYTSGSTGKPKGVMNIHRGLTNLTRAQIDLFAVHADSQVLQFASFSFDASIWEMAIALGSGACLHLASREALQPGQPLTTTLQQHDITHVLLPPSVLATLPSETAFAPMTLIVGGEACPAALARQWASQHRLFNAYGPTESTVAVAIYRCLPDQTGSLPIGRPIANTSIYLLDAQRQPVPIGVAGEIYIGGVQVARGYLNRPDLTQERFLPDPFRGEPDARMYKTGDLGRYLPDGNLVFLGRNDFQVKVRGFRIELGEIEAQLLACPGVREAAVIAREDAPGEKRLVAYVVPAEGAELSVAQLRAQLSANLAEYMVPAAYVTLQSLPLTPNGKLDRKTLPAPGEEAYAKRTYKAPVGAIEATIASIWQELFHVPQIGRRDHFFELGGHSLLAVQFVSRLRLALGIDVALRELFAEPTVAGFAAALVKGKPLLHRNLVAIRPQGSLPPLFLVHPAGGEVAYAHALTQSLDPELPIYGLAASGLLEGEAPLRTVEDMAERYILAIRQIQPRGPYHLAGYSSGGTVAYEMANQLIGADETVAFIGLIDTAHTDGARARQPQVADEANYLLQKYAAAIAAGTIGNATSSILEELKRLASAGDVDAMLVRFQETGLIPGDLDKDALRPYLSVYMATEEAVGRYTSSPIPVSLWLFRATQRPERGNAADSDDLLGWKKLAGNRLRVIPVEGNHQTMIESPHVQHLGTAITQALTESGQQTAGYPEFSYSPLIPIHGAGSDLCPLFCVPGAGASVTSYCALAEALEATRPVYGLQPRGLAGSLVPHIDVPSAACAYISAIRAVYPHGPYQLLGHSFGGWVAFEMARMLAAAGDRVNALILLDSEPPMRDAHMRQRYARVPLLLKLAELFELSSQRPLLLTAADFAPLDHDGQLEILLERMIAAQLVPSNTAIHVLRDIVRVFAANLNTAYVPEGIYDGPLHLVEVTDIKTTTCVDTSPDTQSAVARWRRWAPNTHNWRGPGNHITLLAPPHAAGLAEWVRPLLSSPTSC
jgi:amino acid adenylation domain-containing protein